LRQFIGLLQVQRAGHDLIAQGQRGEDRRHGTGRAQQVSHGRLGGGDGHRLTCAEHAPDGGELAPVADVGGGGMGVQVLHLAGRQARLGQRDLHRAARTVAVLGA